MILNQLTELLTNKIFTIMAQTKLEQIYETLATAIPKDNLQIREVGDILKVKTNNIGMLEIEMVESYGYRFNTVWAIDNKNLEIWFRKK